MLTLWSCLPWAVIFCSFPTHLNFCNLCDHVPFQSHLLSTLCHLSQLIPFSPCPNWTRFYFSLVFFLQKKILVLDHMLRAATPPLSRWLCHNWGSVMWLVCQVNFGTEAWSWLTGTDTNKRGQKYVGASTVWRLGEWEGVVLEMEGAVQRLCCRCGHGGCEFLGRVGPGCPLGWCPWG